MRMDFIRCHYDFMFLCDGFRSHDAISLFDRIEMRELRASRMRTLLFVCHFERAKLLKPDCVSRHRHDSDGVTQMNAFPLLIK